MAGHALRYEFYDYNLTGNYHRLTSAVDWECAKVSDLGSAGWLTQSFAYWALFPAAGFAFTRDRRYARVFARCWRRWFDEYPTLATAEALAGFGDFNSLDPSGIDICMNVGRRALVLLDVLYSGMLASVDRRLPAAQARVPAGAGPVAGRGHGLRGGRGAAWRAHRGSRTRPPRRGAAAAASGSLALLPVQRAAPGPLRSMGDVRGWWGDPGHPPVTLELVDLDGPRGGLVLSHRAYPGLEVRRRYTFDLAARWLEFEDSVTAERPAQRIGCRIKWGPRFRQ